MPLDSSEVFAMMNADQWLGCLECKKSHHVSAFCPKCKKCYFRDKVKIVQDEIVGTLVTCTCGYKDLWD